MSEVQEAAVFITWLVQLRVVELVISLNQGEKFIHC